MRAGVDSAAAAVAASTSTPSWLRAPAGSHAPGRARAGAASPVTCSLLTSASPHTTSPSSATCRRAPPRRSHAMRG